MSSDVTTAAPIAHGFGGTSVTSAAMASAFVAAPVIQRIVWARLVGLLVKLNEQRA